MINTKHEIIYALEQNQASLKALGIKRIGLFGSFLHGAQHPDSDIDLLVEFEPGRKSFDAFMEACFLLDALLQCRIELVTVDSLSPYIAPYILKEVHYVSLAA